MRAEARGEDLALPADELLKIAILALLYDPGGLGNNRGLANGLNRPVMPLTVGYEAHHLRFSAPGNWAGSKDEETTP